MTRPLTIPKRVGFLIDLEGRNINESTPVNAVVLDEHLGPAPLTANIILPQRLYLGSIRVDWQVNSSNTLIGRYDTNSNSLGNQGAGGFNLPDRALDLKLSSQGMRFTETSILGPSIVNEARLGLTFRRLTQRAVSDAPAISVLGSFTSGGAANHFLNHEEGRVEAAESLSLVAGKHNLKFGTQIFFKYTKEARSDNGMFSFGGLIAPELDSQDGIVAGPGGPVLVNISGLEQYRRTLLGLPGGVPTRFSATVGDATNSVTQWTIGGFAQDEWRLLPNLALSFGLRYEGQTSPSDMFRLAPRMGVAFSPDKKRNWVLRARAGIFYDRVPDSLTLESRRLDGSQQQQFIIDSPGFPNPFASGAANAVIPTVRRLDAALRPPGTLQIQFGFERQLPRGWKLEFSHYWTRNWAVLRSRNINSPIPGTNERPLGIQENVLQFESSGKVRGQVVFVGVNQAGNKFFNLYSGYLFFDFRSDTDGASPTGQNAPIKGKVFPVTGQVAPVNGQIAPVSAATLNFFQTYKKVMHLMDLKEISREALADYDKALDLLIAGDINGALDALESAQVTDVMKEESRVLWAPYSLLIGDRGLYPRGTAFLQRLTLEHPKLAHLHTDLAATYGMYAGWLKDRPRRRSELYGGDDYSGCKGLRRFLLSVQARRRMDDPRHPIHQAQAVGIRRADEMDRQGPEGDPISDSNLWSSHLALRVCRGRRRVLLNIQSSDQSIRVEGL